MTLPKNASLRAREKVLVLAAALGQDFYPLARTVTMVAAACFIISGSILSLGAVYDIEALTCGDDCAAQVSGAVEDDGMATSNAPSTDSGRTVTLLSDVPDTLTEPTTVTVEITDEPEIRPWLAFRDQSGNPVQEPLPLTREENDKYELGLDPAGLIPQSYTILLEILYQDPAGMTLYTVGSFLIDDPNAESTPEPGDVVSDTTTTVNNVSTTEEQTDDTASAETTSTDGLTSDEPVETDDLAPDVDTEIDSTNTRENRQEAPATSPETTIDDQADSDPIPVVTTNEPADVNNPPTESESSNTTNPLSFTISTDRTASDITRMRFNASRPLNEVTFYLRPVAATEAIELGTIPQTANVFSFNTRQYPNGQYELFATGQRDQEMYKSESVLIAIFNPVNTPETSPTTATEAASNEEEDRELVTTRNTTTAPEAATTTADRLVSVDESIRTLAKEQLAEDSDELNTLLTAYAAAVQTGDEGLIAAARDNLRTYREKLHQSALADDEQRFIASDLRSAIDREISDLETRVEQFENIRRERTEQASAIDSDEDGISDIDERLIYGTDPMIADSDADGFTDGAEITRGFDPLDAKAEAVIDYQSPKETLPVVKNEKLAVESVKPNVTLGGGESKRVQTTVTGRGLPNSFVTVYVFSTPTIVTVKTDANGMFEYTFSKELEDGEHQVFVALTDNTGAIVAQSQPFTFVKTAEAFTPVDAAEATAQTLTPAASTVASDNSLYRVTIGLSVLALGILLLLLGIGLRVHGREEETVTTAPALS